MKTDLRPQDFPWDHPGMIICPGRFFDRTGSIELPVCSDYPFGADITYLIWRFDDKPDEWIGTMRIRRYAGPNTDPFTGGDTKKWMINKGSDVEKFRLAVFDIARMASLTLNGGKPVKHEIVELNGNSDVFFRVMQEAKPSWMHVQEQKV